MSNQVYVAAAISVVTGLYFIKRYFAGGVCRSKARLDGKTVIVTGANSGIGKETARDLARRGGRIILACRNQCRGEAAVQEIYQCTGNNNVIFKQLDLTSFKSIRKFTDDIINNEKNLHILINNAGLTGERTLTEDGFEKIIGVNHFGPFLLTNLLLEKLKSSAPSRIVNVASQGYTYVKSINFDDIQSEKNFVRFNVYCQSKLANVLFTRELAKRLRNDNIIVNTLHPGAVRTDIWRNVKILQNFLVKLIVKPLAYIFFKSCAEGAQTSIHLAICEEVEGSTGQYFMDCKVSPLGKHALDDDAARKLWDISEKLTRLKE